MPENIQPNAKPKKNSKFIYFLSAGIFSAAVVAAMIVAFQAAGPSKVQIATTPIQCGMVITTPGETIDLLSWSLQCDKTVTGPVAITIDADNVTIDGHNDPGSGIGSGIFFIGDKTGTIGVEIKPGHTGTVVKRMGDSRWIDDSYRPGIYAETGILAGSPAVIQDNWISPYKYGIKNQAGVGGFVIQNNEFFYQIDGAEGIHLTDSSGNQITNNYDHDVGGNYYYRPQNTKGIILEGATSCGNTIDQGTFSNVKTSISLKNTTCSDGSENTITNSTITNTPAYSFWENYPSPGGILKSLDFLSPNDGWVVGYSGVIRHWDGSTWSAVTSPTIQSLIDVDAVSSNDVWATGWHGGIIIHWDGSSWSAVTSPVTADLYGLSMVSSNDGWVVGEDGTVLHWDGSTWSSVTSPTTQDLIGVDAVSSNDGWVVGGNGTVLHWDGSTWSSVTSPTTQDLTDVDAVSSNDVWAIGVNVIIHWDGTSWSIVPSPGISYLEDIQMLSATDGWAVGGYQTLHWDGSEWKNVPSQHPDLDGVYMFSATDGWAVGWDVIYRTMSLPLSPAQAIKLEGASGTKIEWNTVDFNCQYIPFLCSIPVPSGSFMLSIDADSSANVVENNDFGTSVENFWGEKVINDLSTTATDYCNTTVPAGKPQGNYVLGVTTEYKFSNFVVAPACSPSPATWKHDSDADGVVNPVDNCPYYPNKDQQDLDSDGVGTPCDPTEYDVSVQKETYAPIPQLPIYIATSHQDWTSVAIDFPDGGIMNGLYFLEGQIPKEWWDPPSNGNQPLLHGIQIRPNSILGMVPGAYDAHQLKWDEAGVMLELPGRVTDDQGQTQHFYPGSSYLATGPVSLNGVGIANGLPKAAAQYLKRLAVENNQDAQIALTVGAMDWENYKIEERGIEGVVVCEKDPDTGDCQRDVFRITHWLNVTSGEGIETSNPNFTLDCQSMINKANEGDRQGALDACVYNYIGRGFNGKLGVGQWQVTGSDESKDLTLTIPVSWLTDNLPDLMVLSDNNPTTVEPRAATLADLALASENPSAITFDEDTGTHMATVFGVTLAEKDLFADAEKILEHGQDPIDYPSFAWNPTTIPTTGSRCQIDAGSYIPAIFTSLAIEDCDIIWHTEKPHELYPGPRPLNYSVPETNRQGMAVLGWLELDNVNENVTPGSPPIEANLVAGPYSRVRIVNGTKLRGGVSGVISVLNNIVMDNSEIWTTKGGTNVNKYQRDITGAFVYASTDSLYFKSGPAKKLYSAFYLDNLKDPLSEYFGKSCSSSGNSCWADADCQTGETCQYNVDVSQFEVQPYVAIRNSTIKADEICGACIITDGNKDETPVEVTGNNIDAPGNLFVGIGQTATKPASIEFSGNTVHSKGNAFAGNWDLVDTYDNTFNGYLASEAGGSGPALLIGMAGKEFAQEFLGFEDPITYDAFGEGNISQITVADTTILNAGTMEPVYPWVDNSIAIYEAPAGDPEQSGGTTTLDNVTAIDPNGQPQPMYVYGEPTIETVGTTPPVERPSKILARVTANDISGVGTKTATGQQPLANATVKAFNTADACVAANFPDGQKVWQNCSSYAICTTLSNGECELYVNPGKYFVVASEVNRAGKYPSHAIGEVKSGETKLARLAFLKAPDGNVAPGKTKEKKGSSLWIYEPGYSVWDGTEAYYPFVFESDTNWTVDVCVEAPEGYRPVDGVNCLQTLVAGEVRSVLFKLVEVGSVPGKAKIHMRLKGPDGKLQNYEGDIEPRFTPGFAKKKGLDIDRDGRFIRMTPKKGFWQTVIDLFR